MMATPPAPGSLRRLFGRHRIDSEILVGFLVVAGALLGFIALASEVTEGDTLAFDRWLLLALRSAGDLAVPAGPEWLRKFMVDVTALGGIPVLAVITVLVAGYLLAVRKPGTATFVAIAVWSGAAAGTLLKELFLRARPDLVGHLVEVDTASFPSGHAMNSAIAYLTLAALLARGARGRPVRIYLLAVGVGLTVLIGVSRVYLGVHWPTDVIAGWCVGAAWAVLCSLIARTLERRSRRDRRFGPG